VALRWPWGEGFDQCAKSVLRQFFTRLGGNGFPPSHPSNGQHSVVFRGEWVTAEHTFCKDQGEAELVGPPVNEILFVQQLFGRCIQGGSRACGRKSCVRDGASSMRTMPKSVRTAVSFVRKRMFAGLISRCTRFRFRR